MTERKTPEELRLMHIKASSLVQLGAVYRSKKYGDHYVAQLISLRHDDLEPVVSYAPLAAPRGVVFSTPVAEFNQDHEKLVNGYHR